MSRLVWVALIATAAWQIPAEAQDARRSGPSGFFRWFFSAPPAEQANGTIVHERASVIAAADGRRESAIERRGTAERMNKQKAQTLRELRIDRDRRVASAIAKAWVPFQPPRPKRPPSTLLATAGQAEGQAAPTIDLSRPQLPPPPAVSRPSGTPRPRTPAAVVDQVVQQVGSQIIGTPSGKPLSPGLFALVLVGLFLVPAAAITLLLLGIAHLRGHSFVTGSMIIALGGLLLWGTWSLARTINPDLLAQSQPANPDSTSGNLRPMEGLRSDLFWNAE